tara:strand:+ start:46 stop:285 length:240 start_codon:yes stop_codon:yes gene_type:complete
MNIYERGGRGRDWVDGWGWEWGWGRGGASGISMGAGSKDWIFMGRGVVKISGGTLHPTIYNTGSKYMKYRVIILIVEKR